jgi:hypothetical protein
MNLENMCNAAWSYGNTVCRQSDAHPDVQVVLILPADGSMSVVRFRHFHEKKTRSFKELLETRISCSFAILNVILNREYARPSPLCVHRIVAHFSTYICVLVGSTNHVFTFRRC